MNKTELVKAIATKTGVTQKVATEQVAAITEVITEAIKAGDKVSLVGFGTFEARERAERNGVNPATGESILIPACKVPKFKAGKALKEAVNA